MEGSVHSNLHIISPLVLNEQITECDLELVGGEEPARARVVAMAEPILFQPGTE